MMVPERPNSRIRTSPITKGGVMIGRMLRMRRNGFAGNAVRVKTSAKASPMTVVPNAVDRPSTREFTAAPQYPEPMTQASDHTVSSKKRGKNSEIP